MLTCSICSDYLHRSPSETLDVDISCVPCSHVFHTFCIQKWISTAQSANRSTTCPYCRSPFTKRQLRPLNVTSDESKTLLETSITSGTCNQCTVLKNEKEQAEDIKNLIGEELNQYKTFYQQECEDNLRLRKELRRREENISYWETKATMYESLKLENDRLEGNKKELEEKLLHYESIQTAVQGIQKDCNEELEAVKNNPSMVRALVEMKHVLVSRIRENATLNAAQRKQLEENRKLIIRQSGKIDRLEKELDLCKRRCDSLQEKSFSHVSPLTPKIPSLRSKYKKPYVKPSVKKSKLRKDGVKEDELFQADGTDCEKNHVSDSSVIDLVSDSDDFEYPSCSSSTKEKPEVKMSVPGLGLSFKKESNAAASKFQFSRRRRKGVF